MTNTNEEVSNHSYSKTFKEFFMGKKETKNKCPQPEKRVRYISGINDEAWYDNCSTSAYPKYGPKRIEMTTNPPYSKKWPAIRIHPNIK